MFKNLDDPGHGGSNQNYGYSGVYRESDGTLKIALYTQEEMLKYENVQCDLTRDKDKDVSNTTRGQMAARYD